jgi:SM-20-related protein
VIALQDTAMMHEAGTGRTHKAINPQLRGDIIYWLNESETSTAQQAYFSQMEVLRLNLNRHLYLGLFGLESHLALYPTGAGYKKHIDRFKGDSNNQPVRQISCILYLNEDWLDESGGHLRLYLNTNNHSGNESKIDIAPIGGRLVIFLSDTFYHEVLPANRDRASLTGWFLTR